MTLNMDMAILHLMMPMNVLRLRYLIPKKKKYTYLSIINKYKH